MFPTSSIHKNLVLEKRGNEWFALERVGKGFWAFLGLPGKGPLSAKTTQELLELLFENREEMRTPVIFDLY